MARAPLPVALVQTHADGDADANLERTADLVAAAARNGAKLVVTQELFRSPYFCQVEDASLFALAESIPGPSTARLGAVAAEHGVVIVASLFEKRAPGLYHNTVAVLESDGSIAGTYRKMHIPDDPRFYEKFYFTPGDQGFTPIDTSVGRLGVLICWDQWFPEAARLMAMAGAELLIYPTAIGTWAGEMELRTIQHQAWQTLQRSHAIANGLHVLAINRVGVEDELTFWGGSFVATPDGQLLAEAGDTEQTVTATIDFEKTERMREGWPFFRDRRIDAYEDLLRRWRDGTDRD
ncbi:MAG: carbon-nitrogen hydrolase [Planctomycetes bacterium]|nr:carbon-nitrogen hydrolase [Planctomycetota bacterium]MCB9824802.1 carbon-nitrogen hydrolase [Planctomycetota bacterium]MCB9899787.1 carbon-nitrogen hydrolase [Planctomycetota bacterium]